MNRDRAIVILRHIVSVYMAQTYDKYDLDLEEVDKATQYIETNIK